MTTNYNIHLTKFKTDFKATYRDGKFRKLEHLRGTLSQEILNALGNVVFKDESDLEAFKIKFVGKVVYTSEAVKPKSNFTKFQEVWYQIYMNGNQGRKPKFTGADGKALNQIISYLIDENEDETAALATWQFILDNFHHLPDFFKKNQDLKIINSKLNVILTELQNKHTSNERTFQAAAGSEAARSFKFDKNS